MPQLTDPVVAREGMRRLKPLRCIAASLDPDPGSNIGRVCALESANYLRNELPRDADWAGMAHSVEIRVPLVDATLLRTLAPAIPALIAGAGKAALSQTPSRHLPAEVVTRSKTGFAVPTAVWMNGLADRMPPSQPSREGSVSRTW